MKRSFSYFLFFILPLMMYGCLQPYEPPLIAEDTNFLVVDAFLNTTEGSASVKLSRTLPLYVRQPTPGESKAMVTIEEKDGPNYQLIEKGSGLYEGSSLVINLQKQYRVHVRTSDTQEYFSDFVTVKNTPPIDSIFWTAANDGINVYVNTHDDSENSRFYKWDFKETYEYTSAYASILQLKDGVVSLRFESESIFKCYRTDPSTNILVTTSNKLQNDIVSHFKLNFIERGSKKISRKYSILVKQKAITEESYQYWSQLQQTTEKLGGLFDPMPYQITGNFYNATNPAEPVLGFFSGGSVQEKRIFIDFLDLPETLQYRPPNNCDIDTILVADIRQKPNSTLLISSYGIPFPLGYTTSTNDCIDCRLQGGTTKKPEFWK